MRQVFFNARVYAKQKINLTWPHLQQILQYCNTATTTKLKSIEIKGNIGKEWVEGILKCIFLRFRSKYTLLC